MNGNSIQVQTAGMNYHMHTTLNSDYLECLRIMQRASKNYFFAGRFLPPEKKRHVEALYALLRVGDDRVDINHSGFNSAKEAIEDWRDSYLLTFETGDSPHPVLRAYLNTASLFNIPINIILPYFRAMIDDLSVTRFPMYADLLHYMEGSAIVVGRAMCHILGTNTQNTNDAYPAADSLSVAMQLSNFWRDIGEDWRRGRIYIPQEDMVRFGYSEDDLARHVIDRRFISLLNYEIERTRKYYSTAYKGIGLLSSGRWSVINSLKIYSSILDSIQRNHYDIFTRRAEAPTWRKAWLVANSWFEVKNLHK